MANTNQTQTIHFLLLGFSSFILIVLWIICVQQLCITKIRDKQRLRRSTQITFFCTMSIMLNTLEYLSFIYPTTTIHGMIPLKSATSLFEAFVIMTGYHIFRIFNLSIIDRLYETINAKRSKWIGTFFTLLEIFIIVMVFICYSAQFFHSKIQWIEIFYVILAVVICIQAISIIISLNGILKMINSVTILENVNDIQINTAQRALHGAICVAIIVCIVSIVAVINYIEIMYDYIGLSLDKTLVICIDHSMFLIILSGALILWIYKRGECCMIYQKSVCIVYGCGEFWWFTCECCCGPHFGDNSSNNTPIDRLIDN
eukprot:214066_1